MPDNNLRNVLQAAFDHALAYREHADEGPVAPLATVESLRARLNVPLTDDGADSIRILNELVAAVEGGITNNSGGRFFAWVMGGSVPSSLAADWLTSAWDQNAGAYDVAPAAAVAEEVAGEWLKDVLHLPHEASFALVTGCQMAHVTCLSAARHRLLAGRGWDVERDGLFGAPAIRIITSTEAHGTARRAARFLGFGEKSITAIPCGEDGRLPPEALEAAFSNDPHAPTIVLLQAGDLNIGAYDDFAALIPIARRHNAWVHIDGAFGLWVCASEKLRHLARGVELADSWATDGHKWLNVPYDCGYAFIRDVEAHRAAFCYASVYVAASTGRDAIDWTPEWSRRARGFATWAAIRELGRNGIAAMIERTCDHARGLVRGLGALHGAEQLSDPQINQGLVRFLDPRSSATPKDHDAFTDRMTRAINASGIAMFSNTTWRGRRAMRVSVCNWQTTAEDVRRVVESVAGTLAHERRSTE